MNEAYQAQRARALSEMGLRQTSTGSCPRRLAGLPHRDIGCWCSSRLNDHGRRYRRVDDDRPVVLWEPYDAAGHELAEVIEAASADGLTVNITGASPWNPGATFALTFEAAPVCRLRPRSADQRPGRSPTDRPPNPSSRRRRDRLHNREDLT